MCIHHSAARTCSMNQICTQLDNLELKRLFPVQANVSTFTIKMILRNTSWHVTIWHTQIMHMDQSFLDVSRLTQTNKTVQRSVEKSEPAPSVDLLCPRIECQEKARNLCNFPAPTFSTQSFLDFCMWIKNNIFFQLQQQKKIRATIIGFHLKWNKTMVSLKIWSKDYLYLFDKHLCKYCKSFRSRMKILFPIVRLFSIIRWTVIPYK